MRMSSPVTARTFDRNRILVCLLHQTIEDRLHVLPAQSTGLLGRIPVGEPVERVLSGDDLFRHLIYLGQAVLQRRIEDHRPSVGRVQLGVVRTQLTAVRHAGAGGFLADLVAAFRCTISYEFKC
jgi:hypothetical protein